MNTQNYTEQDFINLIQKVYSTRLMSDELKSIMLLILNGQFKFFHNLLSCETAIEFDQSLMAQLINDGGMEAIGYNMFVAMWQQHERPNLRELPKE